MSPSRILLLTAALFVATAAGATTYYVDDTGSDSNPGTFTLPFGTINYAVDQLTAGDTLYVRGGTYHETVLIWDKHGNDSAWIIIEPYNNETVVIDADNADSNVVAIDESEFIYFGNIEVKDGRSGIFIWDAHDIFVGWNIVHGNQRFGIHAGSDSDTLTYNIHIEGNEVYDNVRHNSAYTASPHMQALSAYNAHDVEIIGNFVHENFGEGVDYILSDDGTIKDNMIWDNYGVDLYLDNATDTVVDGNLIVTGWASSPSTYYHDSAPENGIAVANEWYYRQNRANGLTITNNIVLRCKSAFIYWDSQASGGLDNVTIANNTFALSTDIMFVIENSAGHSNTSVVNNIFYQTAGKNYAWAPATNITYATNNWYGGNANTHKSGTNDVMTDPQFADSDPWTDTDVQIASTSPCKDTGTTVSAVVDDYFDDDTARGSSYDIGAHEYR
jgi:hypothetical protein